MARQQLLNDADFVGELKRSIAASVIDDLIIVRQIREALALSLEELTENSTMPATLKARSLAALSTSLKLTQDIQRKALKMDDAGSRQGDELPTLVVRRMTDEEVKAAQDALDDSSEWDDPDEDNDVIEEGESVSGDLLSTNN